MMSELARLWCSRARAGRYLVLVLVELFARSLDGGGVTKAVKHDGRATSCKHFGHAESDAARAASHERDAPAQRRRRCRRRRHVQPRKDDDARPDDEIC